MHPNSGVPNPQDYAQDGQRVLPTYSEREPGARQSPQSGGSSELHNFFADIEDLIRATTSLTGDELEKAKAKLNERVSAAKAMVEKMGCAVADRARNTARVTDDYVHGHPWQAIGASAVVGLLLGALLGRRK
jgi:ElaB/YqjD/DUF883 family membrane-anchored ribosome-binding protein